MTTIILLFALVYLWAAAVLIMAILDDSRFWEPRDWMIYLAFPLTLPATIMYDTYLVYVQPRTKDTTKAVKRLYNWVTGRD